MSDRKNANIKTMVRLMSRSCGASKKELVDEMECHPRTVNRMLDSLDSLHIDFIEKPDYDGNTNSKRWFITEKNFSQPLLTKLNSEDWLVIRMLLSNTHFFTSRKNKRLIKDLKQTIESSYIKDTRRRVKTAYTTFKGFKDYEDKEAILSTISWCISNNRTATVTYQKAHADTPKTYDIELYTLVDHGNALYLIVAIPKYDGDIRVLAVDRIIDMQKKEGVSFELPSDYDPDTYLGSSFGIFIEDPIRVVVRFNEYAGLYAAERIWGQDQAIVKEEDGSMLITFTACGIDEIKRWVLSYGCNARVLEPELLVSSVADEII
ncbi:MAG TPA: WYL domain-containing protein, partial [Treponemataceae bacterium]|nr:WYL domain-containing protein [Treponemataceae bacterium]